MIASWSYLWKHSEQNKQTDLVLDNTQDLVQVEKTKGTSLLQ